MTDATPDWWYRLWSPEAFAFDEYESNGNRPPLHLPRESEDAPVDHGWWS